MSKMYRTRFRVKLEAAASPEEQKKILGDRLFPLISEMHPKLASKITGMLLEDDNSDLVHLLEHQESLKNKVEEAVAVLQAQTDKMDVEEVVVVFESTDFGQQQQHVNGTSVKFQPMTGFETIMKSGVEQNISTRFQVRFLRRIWISLINFD